jgi:Tol biopolymer transport system component
MGSRFCLAAMMLCACDARLAGIMPNVQFDASRGADAASGPIDGPSFDAPLGLWTAAVAVDGASLPMVNQDDPTLNSTQTELYFKKPGAAGDYDLFWMTRVSPSDPWGMPAPLTQLNTSATTDESPRLSPDDLTLYFGKGGDIYMSTRASTADPWGPPSPVTEVNTATYEKWMAVCNGGYYLVSRGVARANNTTDQDLFVGQLGSNMPSALAAQISATGSNEISSFLSADCKTAFFASNSSGNVQIYTATRSDPTSPFSAPTLYENFGTATDDEDPWISPDQRTFILASIRGGSTTKAVYMSTR